MFFSRPASPPSRYRYSLKIDLNSLPEGVTLNEVGEIGKVRLFISNASNIPLIINEIFDMNRLISGQKLVSGRVYQYFPNGIPMEGMTHLKGWQLTEGSNSTYLYLQKDPKVIYDGRRPYLSKNLPESEYASIPANYDGQPYKIKCFIHYYLNEFYDEYYANQEFQKPIDTRNC